MKIREMTTSDIQSVLPLYVSYYNEQEDGCWTGESAGRRIHQVLCMEDSFSLILEEKESVLGFAMGYFKQCDDITGYTLEEIVIAYEYQNQGIGSTLMWELERTVKEKGASCIEIQSVNDEHHERFYGKADYHNAKKLC